MKAVITFFVGSAYPFLFDVTFATESDQSLEEVVVIGTRLKAYELRQQLVEAEDKFYARYNDLNKRNEFDVNCVVVAPTGTNLKRRSCRPVFEENATQRVGQETFTIRQSIQEQTRLGNIQQGPGTPPVSAAGEIAAVRPEFQSHMRNVVLKDAGLKELLTQRALIEQAIKSLDGEPPSPNSDSSSETEAQASSDPAPSHAEP